MTPKQRFNDILNCTRLRRGGNIPKRMNDNHYRKIGKYKHFKFSFLAQNMDRLFSTSITHYAGVNPSTIPMKVTLSVPSSSSVNTKRRQSPKVATIKSIGLDSSVKIAHPHSFPASYLLHLPVLSTLTAVNLHMNDIIVQIYKNTVRTPPTIKMTLNRF